VEDSLNEIVPQDTSRIFQNPNKYSNICSFRPLLLAEMCLQHGEQFTEFTKSREAPVTLLRNETMVSICG